MEKLLHYCWKHRIFPEGKLMTTDGRELEIADSGLHNSSSGPDFFNAKVRIGGELWAGNVEMHIAAKDWFAHKHDKDEAYNNVILHVVSQASSGRKAVTSNGCELPEFILNVPAHVRENYEELLSVDSYPPCYKNIPNLTSLKIHSWMASLQTERLMQKTTAVSEYLQQLDGDWEHAYFVSLARSFGFGSNTEALEQWAMTLPLKAVAHHRDDLLQVEALFLGHAGLIRIIRACSRNTTTCAESSRSHRWCTTLSLTAAGDAHRHGGSCACAHRTSPMCAYGSLHTFSMRAAPHCPSSLPARQPKVSANSLGRDCQRTVSTFL